MSLDKNMYKFTSKIKKFFHNSLFHSILKIVLISFTSVLVSVIILISLLWHFRSKIFTFIAENLPKDSNLENILTNTSFNNEQVKSDLEEVRSLISQKGKEESEIIEDSVVNAVKIAKPAVVSILILKEVPKYILSYKYDYTRDENGKPIPNLYTKEEIKTQDGVEWKQVGSGSGFLVNSNGLIVTNKHVVNQKSVKYRVLLNSGVEYDATVLASDSILDIALIKINASKLPYLSLSDSDKIEVGQSVVAIGNALGEFKNTVSSGVVSGLSRSIVAGDKYGLSEKLDEVIQTDAAINKGNSGGPLLNLKGEVVGINVAVVEDSANIGFALPINSVKYIISSVEKTGKIIRPYVGIRYIPITEIVKAKYSLSVNYGILIKKGKDDTEPAVLSGSPAEKAGVKEGDIILEVDGIKINSSNDFASLVRNKKVGDAVVFKILSNEGERMSIVKLEQSPSDW